MEIYIYNNDFTLSNGNIVSTTLSAEDDTGSLKSIKLNYEDFGAFQNFLTFDTASATFVANYYSGSMNGNLVFTPATATPEPTSLALLAASAPCLMLVRRLRRKQAV